MGRASKPEPMDLRPRPPKGPPVHASENDKVGGISRRDSIIAYAVIPGVTLLLVIIALFIIK